jgi:histidinol dehydrogenase
MSATVASNVADVADVAATRIERNVSPGQEVRSLTSAIINRVRRDGDAALRELSLELDAVELEEMEVPYREMQRALDEIDAPLRAAMERATRNIAKAHSFFALVPREIETEPGVLVGRRPDPLRRVGIYVPGGRASYPSSLLMCAIPARLAGVREVIVCSPRPSRVVLAAAAIAKVDRVFALGGAGAIAAMALGTDTVPRVDKIVGPGNAYVCEAKLQLVGMVAIDTPAGPSELLVIADDSAEPDVIAREAAAQLEHDPRATVAIVVVEGAQRNAQSTEPFERALEMLGARATVLRSLTVHEAVRFANEYAPEHLLLAVRNPEGALASVRNAGTVFLGQTSSVAFGDYMTGANHVLPTGGLARSYSGLSTLDFVRWTTYQRVSREAAAALAGDVAVFAEAERLAAHAAAARQWEAT